MNKPLTAEALTALALEALDSLKAQDIITLDIRDKASFADYMIVASGTSDRHLKAMADQLHIDAKAQGNPPLSTEGADSRNWILVDLGDVVVHLMKPETRTHYELEKLWSIGPERSKATNH